MKFHYEFDEKKDKTKPFAIYGRNYLQSQTIKSIHWWIQCIRLVKILEWRFGIKKCGILVLKRGEVHKTKTRSLNLPNGKLMKTVDEEWYKYLGILEYDKVKEKETKTEFVR